MKNDIPKSSSGSLLLIVILVGDPIKSDLRERYIGKGFSPNYMTTIGADFALIERTFLKRSIKFQIWDLVDASQYKEKWGESKKPYPPAVHGALIVINAEKPLSITDVERQIKHIQIGARNEQVPIVVACIQGSSSKKQNNCYSSDDIQIITQGRESSNSSSLKSNVRYFQIHMNDSQEIINLLDTLWDDVQRSFFQGFSKENSF